LNAALTHWDFQRGFLDYVVEQEMTTITEAAASLYQDDGNWEPIRDDPRRMRDLLQQNAIGPTHERRPTPQQRRRPPGGRLGGPKRFDPLGLGRRVSLVDADAPL